MKKKYEKPLFKLIGSDAEAAQCIAGFAPTSTNQTCASGPAANFLCNAGSWADTQCYSGLNAIGPAETNCLSGSAAGTSCKNGTAAGSQNPSPVSCSGGFSASIS